MSSGDFSEPCTPHTKMSPKTSLVHQQDEINRKYHELQQQISLEFQTKQREWERIRNLSIAAGNVPYNSQTDDYSSGKEQSKSPSTPLSSKPIEENLTADFRKKLQEWRIKQSQSNSSVKDMQSSPTKEGDKKIDWNLWKTGQIKLEGQGLKQMPDEKDLPEEFQRKLDEWKRIKASGGTSGSDINTASKRLSLKSGMLTKTEFGSSKKLKASADDLANNKPNSCAGEREKLFRLKSIAEPKPAKEVVVQTTKGALKFEGISRKFTQKLYEWEKARGIGPESSTFALLHPGYRPLVVGSGELEVPENKPSGGPMGRSMSMDSMSPHASAPSIVSQQPSSLSLNNVDDIVDTKSLTPGCGRGGKGMFGSSNSDLDLDGDDDDDDDEDGNILIRHRKVREMEEDEEPEAVIVEVEDDYVETADSLFTATPIIEKQTPIYRYEQTRKEYYAGNKEAVFVGECKPTIAHATSKALKDATRLVTSFREVRHGFKENVEHVQRVLKSLIDTVPSLKTSLQDNSDRLRESVDVIQNLAKIVIDKLTELEQTASSKEDLDAKMTAIDGQLNILRKALNFVCKHTASRKTSRNEDVPAISITFDEPQPPPPERNVAVVSLAPIVFQGQVVINQVQVMDDRHRVYLPAPPRPPAAGGSELELSDVVCSGTCVDGGHMSDCDSGNKNTTTDTTGGATSSAAGGDGEPGQHPSEQETDADGLRRQMASVGAATVCRQLSNGGGSGTKRKVKLRRMGSRQNSKTESDSDEDALNVVLDAPSRRLKRKTSRAKRLTESASLDRGDEAIPTVVDEVVFTIKLKPIEPPTVVDPDPLEVLENLPVDDEDDDDDNNGITVSSEFVVSSNVFVQTKRRIYTPVADQPGAAIGKDIGHDEPLRLVTNLPPLPQSPGQQRRQINSPSSPGGSSFTKEPSPAIRLMIAKYNQRLSCSTAERRNSSPLQQHSGSCSPVAWHSPVLERRAMLTPPARVVANPTITKSSSAGNMGRELKLTEVVTIHPADAAVSQLVKGVLKSSSAGILTDTWQPHAAGLADRPQNVGVDCSTPLACDSLKKISVSKIGDCGLPAGADDPKAAGLFRKNSGPTSAASTHHTNAILRKVTRSHRDEPATSTDEATSSICNTLPRITRKYDATSKPPSPRLAARRPTKLSLDLNLRSANPTLVRDTPDTANAAAVAAAAAALSERALKLRKAKEEFLKMSAGYRSACQHLETEVIWRKNRTSENGATPNDDDDDEDDDDDRDDTNGSDAMVITKSASVGMISQKCAARRRTSETTAAQAATHATDGHGLMTLPRHATRQCKSQGAIVERSAAATATTPPATSPTATGSSKFGFMLAKTLRRVKLRRNSKDLNTVTKLCRQSLMVDVPETQAAAASENAGCSASAVRKSGSAQTMGGLGSLLFRRAERAEKLKKSKSIGQLDGSG